MVGETDVTSKNQRISSRAALSARASLPLELRQIARQRREQGLMVYDFGLGEGEGLLPGVMKAALRQAVEKEQTQYAPAAGLPELKAAVLSWLGNEFKYSPEHVVISAGAAHSMFSVFLTLVNPGDVILLPPASREECHALGRWAGARPVVIPSKTAEDNYFKMRKEDLIAALDAHPQAKLMVLTNPCNPTGQVYTSEEMGAFAEICADCSTYLVLDRRFWTITFAPAQFVDPVLPERVKPWLVQIDSVANSFSHAGGLRVGWTIAPPDVAEALRELQTHCHGSASTLSQEAACAALSLGRDVDYLRGLGQKRDTWLELTKGISGVKVFPIEGTFYSLWDVREILSSPKARALDLGSGNALADHLLEQHGIISTPGDSYGIHGFLRFSFSVPDQTLRDGIAELERAFAALR